MLKPAIFLCTLIGAIMNFNNTRTVNPTEPQVRVEVEDERNFCFVVDWLWKITDPSLGAHAGEKAQPSSYHSWSGVDEWDAKSKLEKTLQQLMKESGTDKSFRIRVSAVNSMFCDD